MHYFQCCYFCILDNNHLDFFLFFEIVDTLVLGMGVLSNSLLLIQAEKGYFVTCTVKTCVKWPLSKKIGFQDQLSINAGQMYLKGAFCNTFDPNYAISCHLDLSYVYFWVAVLHRLYYNT